MARATRNGPGVIRPVLTDSSKDGLFSILFDLEGFYSPLRNDRGMIFDKHSRNVFDSSGNVFAYINIKHLKERIDDSVLPAKMQQVYSIFFNVRRSSSEKERDAFLDYVNGLY